MRVNFRNWWFHSISIMHQLLDRISQLSQWSKIDVSRLWWPERRTSTPLCHRHIPHFPATATSLADAKTSLARETEQHFVCWHLLQAILYIVQPVRPSYRDRSLLESSLGNMSTSSLAPPNSSQRIANRRRSSSVTTALKYAQSLLPMRVLVAETDRNSQVPLNQPATPM